ncbi:cytochrome c oxidase subunit II [Compostibacter hankyongensis]|uniref:Cytochrome c oxidase subunit 2 n=1 Tax=Compostibacter hankyongensis TaxID=1007089 RepID=A0ABP8FDX2_9BACT
MSGLFIVLTVVLILIVVFQISRASEYVAVLKGEKKADAQSNQVNAALMIVFLVLGLIGVYYCNELLKGRMLPEAASIQGKAIDRMMNVTLIITGIVFVITQIMLFVFAYRFRATEKRKAYYYPHNNKLELAWTVVPAIVLTILVAIGLKHWFSITSDAPKDAMLVEVTGKQFNWMFRYPGKDGVLGKKNYQLVDESKGNMVGQDWSDPANHDDVMPNEMHLVVNKPVKLLINSRDVIHDVGLPYFRLKMDAVPGIPTTMWFTPTITTQEMIKKTGNPNFVYKLVCDQLCGKSHYSMTANIVVETQEEFDKWIATQPVQYQLAMSSEAPAGGDSTQAAAPADSTAAAPAADSSVAPADSNATK